MIKIRNAVLKDCRECAVLSRIEELSIGEGSYIGEKYFKNFVDKDKMFFVAEDKKKIIGYILGEPMKGSLANLGLLTVDKNERGNGIGKMLIKKFRERCDEKKLRYILLYAPEFNKNTQKFYTACGFSKGKKHVQFFEDNESK